ncbi:MAG: hypothetical protein C0623_09370 [Desulfuromonas sp.]|nr:MAG: hypothetical protein C0623_09370 [Desulfuromonas sp.]
MSVIAESQYKAENVGQRIIKLDVKTFPSGWKVVQLGDVIDIQGGSQPPKSNFIYEPKDDYVRLLQIRDFGKKPVPTYVPRNKVTKFCEKDDVLIARYGASLGRILTGMEGAYNVALAKTIFDKEIIFPKYLFYLLQTPLFQTPIHMISRSAQNGFNKGEIYPIEIPIAPLEQQKRIVAEIEKQFSRLDEAVANLKRVKANLKRYKASVLKASVEGKLTEEWRKQHLPAPSSVPGKFYTYAILCDDDSIYIGHTDDIERRWKEHRQGQGAEWTQKHKPVKIAHYEEHDTRAEAAEREKWLKTGFGRKWLKRELAAGRTRQAGDVEPADKLLERILEERRANWQGRGKYKEPVAPDTDGLPELPEGWVWTNFEQLAEGIPNAIKAGPFGSALKKLFYVQKGYKIYGQEQVIREDPYYGDYYVDEQKYQDLLSCAVKSGDLLISLVGTIGRVLILPDGIEPGIINPRLVKISLNKEIINPLFIKIYLQSTSVKAMFAIASHGGTMDILNLGILKGIPIPLPPVSEQSKILEEFDRIASIEAGLVEGIEANSQRSDRLRQSILKNAFSGELCS